MTTSDRVFEFDYRKLKVRDRLRLFYCVVDGDKGERADAMVECMKSCGSIDGEPVTDATLAELNWLDLARAEQQFGEMLSTSDIATDEDVEARAKN